MNLVRSLLNACPGSSARAIRDKRGRRYWLYAYRDDNTGLPFRIELVYRGKSVGYVNLLWELPEKLKAADLCVVPDHRGRGLGAALLDEVRTLAQEHNVGVIEGLVVKKDVEETPYLLHWYRHFGFQVVPVKQENTVALVFLRLVKAPNRA